MAVVLVAVCATAVIRTVWHPKPAPPGPHTATLAADGRSRATLEVVETEPTIKSQTAASSYKPAMLSNGVRTMVPPFVTTGTKIVVMTADGSYVERAKE